MKEIVLENPLKLNMEPGKSHKTGTKDIKDTIKLDEQQLKNIFQKESIDKAYKLIIHCYSH